MADNGHDERLDEIRALATQASDQAAQLNALMIRLTGLLLTEDGT